MHLKLILLLWIPGIVNAALMYTIQVGRNGSTTLKHSSISIEVIKEKLEQAFLKVDDDTVKKSIVNYTGGAMPDRIYVSRRDDWSEGCNTFLWTEVKRKAFPQKGEILMLQRERVNVHTETYKNEKQEKITYDGAVNFKMNNTLEPVVKPSKGKLNISGIYTKIIIDDVNESIFDGMEWANSKIVSRLIKISGKSKDSITLAPGESAVVSFDVLKTTVAVKLPLKINFTGFVAAYYIKEYLGHHYWLYDINYFKYPTLSAEFEVVATIYTDPIVTLKKK